MRALPLLLLSLALGCETSGIGGLGGDGDDTDGSGEDTDGSGPGSEPDGMLRVDQYTETTNTNGLLRVKVEVGADVTSFLVTGESDEYVSLESLEDPEGNQVLYWQDWWSNPESLTYAFFGFDKTTAFNWPVREQDGPLQEGTWIVELSTIDNQGSYAANADLDVSVHTKADDDLQAGHVQVTILWADGVDSDDQIVHAVESAVERWREVWGMYGLTLEESYQSSTLDPMLGFTYGGSNQIENVTSDLEPGSLVLIVGESVGNETTTFGVSAGIPGTLAASDLTFVVLAWTSHAGANGAFDDDEIRLMGETMAHEVGHYTGLFHPVEWSYDLWDALEDTTNCTSWQSCDTELGDNLMYPYPICSFSSCEPQDQLTADQQAVAHRYTGTL